MGLIRRGERAGERRRRRSLVPPTPFVFLLVTQRSPSMPPASPPGSLPHSLGVSLIYDEHPLLSALMCLN
ncbi:FLZ-type domain-containing protein [Psidium guajava]|nr:FLZ-type domain-containing protein [Psidium guajava]